MPDLKFFEQLVLRTPYYSCSSYRETGLQGFLDDPRFRLAVYLASPEFYRVLKRRSFVAASLNKKETFSLRKYVNRMCFRPTPYGAFAAVGLVGWENQERDEDVKAGYKLHVLPDQGVSLHLAEMLLAARFDDIVWQLNPVLYTSGGQHRFVRTNLSEKIRFRMESLETNLLSASLFRWMEERPRRGSELIGWLMDFTGCTEADARDYAAFLRQSTIVMSSLAPNLTGADYLERLVSAAEMKGNEMAGELAALLRGLREDDCCDLGSLMNAGGRLEELAGEVPASRSAFYAVLERAYELPPVGGALQEELAGTLKCLKALTPPAGDAHALKDFVRRFRQRFDQRKIPLLEALDPDCGIDYSGLARQHGGSALLEDLEFRPAEDRSGELRWSAAHKLLLGKWAAQADKSVPLILTKEDLKVLGDDAVEERLPPSFPVLFRRTREGLLIDSAGAASSLSLLGRFGHTCPGIGRYCEEIARWEQQQNPGVLFAELCQLSDAHADNINRRGSYYDYEIPVNAVSLKDPAQVISLSDLAVSVAGGKVVLESLSRNKIVVPRLSSAYNYSQNSLSVFRFLCDLQYQGLRWNFSFDFKSLFPGLNFYPRVQYGQTIISPAQWLLKAESMKNSSIGKLRENLGLPDKVAFARFDQQLVFDLNRPEEAEFFGEVMAAARGDIQLTEHFGPAADITGNAKGAMANQFIAVLGNRQVTYEGEQTSDHTVRRPKDFILGSRWLFLKLFCTPSMSNQILVGCFFPLLKRLQREDRIAGWFFIRYNSPDYHLRLRVLLNGDNLGEILSLFRSRVSNQLNAQLIHDYQADTYRPEIERYSVRLIEGIEQLFMASSNLTAAYISRLQKVPSAAAYHSLAFVLLRDLLTLMLPSDEERLNFLGQLSISFYAEFSREKHLRISLDRQFRQLRPGLKRLLADPLFYRSLGLLGYRQQVMDSAGKLAERSGRLNRKRRWKLLSDILHMQFNRLFVDDQRKQEMVVYYHYHKFFKGELAVSAGAA
ncbi:hypothetical protein GS399_05180 [Pedobacter sp. HMF7647]|uniref:Lantibiotic dehydratase n=1 Tax=Hufsiella arboris TaxID=2695275 RepID=A0A7K1Y709_9SPHI|nr:lantibiotic dehydratase [Hufsiella arboris]MXV50357.1 hypothetical protein [Hufsiella arboris]